LGLPLYCPQGKKEELHRLYSLSLVEESEKQDLMAAITLYEGLKEGIFPIWR
jgi:hypothetical protein